MLRLMDNDIMVMLDGDDWLASKLALWRVAEAYEDSAVLGTYGTYVYFPHGIVQPAPAFEPSVLRSSSFRREQWISRLVQKGTVARLCVVCDSTVRSHLKTVRAWLWKELDRRDLYDNQTGRPWQMTGDQAIMFSLLELSGGCFRPIEAVTYVYNFVNPISDFRKSEQIQLESEKRIRSLTPRNPLVSKCLQPP